MAIISITIPDAQVSRVLDAVATRHGWLVGSGLTKAQFAKQYLIDVLKADVKFVEGLAAKEVHRLAGNVAEQDAQSSVDSQIPMT